MTVVPLGTPTVRSRDNRGGDRYGHARLPASARAPLPGHVDKIEYGRFRNVYLYITEACQLRCEHCYMGERLDRALKMPYQQVIDTLHTWRKMGGSKLTILGGEPTLHPDYVQIIRASNALGFEHVITTSNGLDPAMRKFDQMEPDDFAYVQISLDGGSATSHDLIRGEGRFEESLRNVGSLAARGFDTRIICTVNRANAGDALQLLDIADNLGVSLVKYHVFSTIGTGHDAPELAMDPVEWIEFYEELERVGPAHETRTWFQPTYARRSRIADFAAQGYCGCIGRTLDRISIFPDGRCYVCSYLFDTELHFANMIDGNVVINKGPNEFDLFTQASTGSSCGDCKAPNACGGGCPAEELVMGAASCAVVDDIVPVCRLWKADVPKVVTA